MESKTAFGGMLIAVGLMTVVGSVTGNLPAMLGSLFDPAAIVTKSGNASVPATSRITNGIKSAITGAITPAGPISLLGKL